MSDPALLTAVAAAVQGERHRMTIGLRPLHEDDWIEELPDTSEQLRLRQHLLATRDDVAAAEPGSEDGQLEVLELLAAHLPRRFPSAYQRHADGLLVLATGTRVALGERAPEPAIIRAGRLVAEDLCLMRPAADGGHRLVAACLCFPSRWRLADKMGAPMLAIHAPVPGYAGNIGAPTDRTLAALDAARPVWRQNWSLMDAPDLYQPQRMPLSAARARLDAGERLWVRSERQTLRRLPRSGDLLFTIRIRQVTLAALCSLPGMAARLLAHIESMPAALRDYKQITAIEDELCGYLRRRAGGHAAGV